MAKGWSTIAGVLVTLLFINRYLHRHLIQYNVETVHRTHDDTIDFCPVAYEKKNVTSPLVTREFFPLASWGGVGGCRKALENFFHLSEGKNYFGNGIYFFRFYQNIRNNFTLSTLRKCTFKR